MRAWPIISARTRSCPFLPVFPALFFSSDNVGGDCVIYGTCACSAAGRALPRAAAHVPAARLGCDVQHPGGALLPGVVSRLSKLPRALSVDITRKIMHY